MEADARGGGSRATDAKMEGRWAMACVEVVADDSTGVLGSGGGRSPDGDSAACGMESSRWDSAASKDSDSEDGGTAVAAGA